MGITVGLRELRQGASDLVRRVEAGEDVTVTVAGRPSVRLVAIAPRRWRRWQDVADLFGSTRDDSWDTDRDLMDHAVEDPWVRS